MGIQLSLFDSTLLSTGLSSLSGSIRDDLDTSLSVDLTRLHGRRVVFSKSSSRHPLVQWAKDGTTHVPELVNTDYSPTVLAAVDSSIIPICDLDDGRLYVSRVGVVFSIGGRPAKYLRLGPFLFDATGDSLTMGIGGLEGRGTDESFLEAAIRTKMERSAVAHLSQFLRGSVILVDGTLRLVSAESPYPEIIQEARRNNNSLIGISKTSKLQSISRIASELRGKKGAPFFCRLRNGLFGPSGRSTVIAKFRDDGLAFRTEILGRGDSEVLALVSGNDSFYRGYPESLRLAHHLSVFTPFEATCIRSHLTRVLKLVELPSEDTRDVILRWYWSSMGAHG